MTKLFGIVTSFMLAVVVTFTVVDDASGQTRYTLTCPSGECTYRLVAPELRPAKKVFAGAGLGGFAATTTAAAVFGAELQLNLALSEDWDMVLAGGAGYATSEDGVVGWLGRIAFMWWAGEHFSFGPSAFVLGGADDRGNRLILPAVGPALALSSDRGKFCRFVFSATPFLGVAVEDPADVSFGGGAMANATLVCGGSQ